TFSTSSLRMTSMISSRLQSRSKRNQRNAARLLDRFTQAFLVRSADARYATGRDLASLGNKAIEQSRVLIVNIVDLLDAESAHFLAPEVLFLSGSDGLIAAGRSL